MASGSTRRTGNHKRENRTKRDLTGGTVPGSGTWQKSIKHRGRNGKGGRGAAPLPPLIVSVFLFDSLYSSIFSVTSSATGATVDLMSIFQPVNLAARRTFCPPLPIARDC